MKKSSSFKEKILLFFKKAKDKWHSFSGLKKIFLAFSIFVVVMAVGMTVGRYVYVELRDFYLASKNFYFNSDKLDDPKERYRLDNWSGAESYVITFNMDSYKNNNVFATSDILYDVTYSCSSNVTCTATKDTGVISSAKHTDSFAITITPSTSLHDGDTVWLDVAAESQSPYVKKLSAYFVITVGRLGISYEIVDRKNSPYLDLTITNTLDYYEVDEAFGSYQVGDRIDITTYLTLSQADQDKCSSVIIDLEFDPREIVLDMTNENYLKALSSSVETINTFDYIKGMSFKIDAVSSAVVRFYKKDATKDYTYPFVNSASVVKVVYD